MSNKKIIDFSIAGLSLAVLFFLSALVFSRIILKAEEVYLPDLTGKTIAEARGVLQKKDLGLVQKGSEFDDRWERGRIIRQAPAAGSKIRVTAAVQVMVSSGSRKVTVPRLEGKSMDAALPILREAGLVKGCVTQIHTPHPAGLILAQNPGPSKEVDRNTPVGFLMSQGIWEERYIMPDIIGKRLDAVRIRLEALGFNIGDIRYSYYPGLGKGIIIKQSPPNGYRIQKRNMIMLEVSR
jgi:beta-lactam-binding protein with PASTA domain